MIKSRLNQSSIQRIFSLWEENEKEHISRIVPVTKVQLNKLHPVSLQCYTPFLNDYGTAIDRSPLNFLWYLPCLVLQLNQNNLVFFSLLKMQDVYQQPLPVGHYKDWESFHVILMSLLYTILFFRLVGVHYYCIFLYIWSCRVWSKTFW